ncbi:undecaprenyl-diphosphatase UppP [Sulfobacillus acidophilus]|uniref:Undecaprenyl-diphosphatase n=1 Tax=Sulfobacillus acidophilus TaxID=53633 RepID=A0ABS3AVN8_9FIRM|nr:undecaprenyl-diphosphatase UppP [Sulfobacillus acidophilus]
MDSIHALILGIVQGVTEYLPVSSSAHLILVPKILGFHISHQNNFVFDILVQLGTLVGVVFYFYDDLLNIAKQMCLGIYQKKPFLNTEARLGWLVLLATIPASIIGLSFKDEIASLFSSTKAALIFLIVTAIILVVAELFAKSLRNNVKISDSLAMGFAQSLALFPGISRSGSTISTGMLLGLSRQAAAKFSFIMSIPVMVGASIIAFKELFSKAEMMQQMVIPLLVGFVAAAISGYLVIKWFLAFLKQKSLLWFAAYCFAVGFIGLIVI